MADLPLRIRTNISLTLVNIDTTQSTRRQPSRCSTLRVKLRVICSAARLTVNTVPGSTKQLLHITIFFLRDLWTCHNPSMTIFPFTFVPSLHFSSFAPHSFLTCLSLPDISFSRLTIVLISIMPLHNKQRI